MGFAAIAGEGRAAELFGTVFPRAQVVRAFGGCEVDAPDCAVIADGKALAVKAAIGLVFSADRPPERFPDGIQLICCGMGAKNTVSLSSRTGDSITLSLNRRVATLNGPCEPLELPVKTLVPAEDWDYMAAFAAAVLLGAIR